MAIPETRSSEGAVLSTILNRLEQNWFAPVYQVGGNNSEELFSSHQNQAIFSAIQSFYTRGVTPTISGVTDKVYSDYEHLFDDDIEDYLNSIRLTPPVMSVEQLNDILQDLSSARKLRKQIKEIESILSDINDPEIESSPEDVAKLLSEISDYTEISSDAQTFSELTQEILDSDKPSWGQTTGIEELDEVLGGRGFEGGCLTIIAARPKVGKTIFMNSMVNAVLKNGGYPLVFNLETKKVEFLAKMMASYIAHSSTKGEDTISWMEIKNYLSKEEGFYLTKKKQNIVEDAISWSLEQEWYTSFNKSMTMHNIEALVRKGKSEAPVDKNLVIFVDYLQLQVTNSFHEREEITQLSRFYKKLAGELNVSIVCLSQMNREGGKDGELDVRNLRGSGSLEQDADTIIMLDRPHIRDETKPAGELIVNAGTTRLAEGGTFKLFIDGATNVIGEMTDEMRQAFHNEEDDFSESIVDESASQRKF